LANYPFCRRCRILNPRPVYSQLEGDGPRK